VCGICGVIALEGPLDPAVRSGVRGMNAALAHRGPDGDGFHDDGPATLAHRRLAIIDRAGGSQPMPNEDGTCWIVFNGEIYNHRALRPVLEARGHRFRTVSDTETIVHAWEEYGTACVERLEGMFAFALYDSRKRELFIARDRLGKKPLFYAVFDGVLHFASELGALQASPVWQGDLDLSALEGYLSLGYFLAPNTAYRHVRKLEPGCWLHVANGRIATACYWDVTEFGTDHRDQAAQLADVEATLGIAVRDRLESEVPLGAFLSGGIDSGLVVSFMAEALADPVVTATVGFADAAHNELGAARLTAAHFHTEHHEQVVAPRLQDVFERVVDHLGEPMADSSAIPTWYVSQSARRHVTVALSGDGGDETFAGYDFRYVPHLWESRARGFVPGAPGRRLARWLGTHWPRARALPQPLRLGTIFENLSYDPAAAYYLDLCFLKPPEARALLGLSAPARLSESPVYAAVTDPYRRCDSSEPLQRAQYADLKVYMPNDPLVKVDRMSMAHSLEVRCPLLDRRVVELAFRIPAARKLRRRTGKVLLRALAGRRLPAELAALPKRGFTLPIGEWIGGPYRHAFSDDVLGPGSRVSTILDIRIVRRLLGEFQPGMASHAYALWAVWLLEKWLRRQPSGAPTESRAAADATFAGG
jgi:asparagine synthase (glutamine-hydrolysing)